MQDCNRQAAMEEAADNASVLSNGPPLMIEFTSEYGLVSLKTHEPVPQAVVVSHTTSFKSRPQQNYVSLKIDTSIHPRGTFTWDVPCDFLTRDHEDVRSSSATHSEVPTEHTRRRLFGKAACHDRGQRQEPL